jgi:hypothetical protein
MFCLEEREVGKELVEDGCAIIGKGREGEGADV